MRLAPVVLVAATASAETSGLAFDAMNLYWTNSQEAFPPSVMQCAKDNCEATLLTLAFSRPEAAGIAVDDHDVYWSDADGLMRCAIGGCSHAPAVVSAGAGLAVAVGGSRVYVAQSGTSPTDGRITFVAK